jgi:ABC-type glycerol-3-phosphate transport system substrate-binding protein
MSKFQIGVIAIFVICIGLGVALFANYKSSDQQDSIPVITIWGTFPASTFASYVQQINSSRETQFSVNYVQKALGSFDKDFIETLARGQGPDVILVPQEMVSKHADKLVPIPYNVLTERDFKNSYISEAELYLTSQGSLGIPLTIDPLVMYWNRDIFSNAGIAKVPVYWDEFTTAIGKINQKDTNSNIRRSTLALGEFNNVTHAREILSTLFMQAGNPVTARGEVIQSTLGDRAYAGTQSSTPAITFFTQFSNPQNKQYSWNRSLPSSKSWFLSGNLATYFGFASELRDIREKNPNIDFDVAPLPQARGGKNRVTYGSMYGFSIVRTATDQLGAFSVLQILTAPDSLALLSNLMYLPPVRRDMIATGSTDPYQVIFYDSALISKSWLDKDPSKSNLIFQNMIESITSGRVDVHTAVNTASDSLDLYLQTP